MTGGATGTLLFGKEDTFKGSVIDSDSSGNPDYYSPGRNPTITDGPELSHQLQRMRQENDVESVESIAQNLEGAFGIEATVSADTFDDLRDIVFNDGTGSEFVAGRANTSRWYVDVNYLDGTVERELVGCVPTDMTIAWTQGGNVRVSITFVYATENTDVTAPTDVTRASNGSSAAFHDASLSVDTVTTTKAQSWTLSISNIARLQYGESREALDAVIAAPQTGLDLTSVITEEDQLDHAYGNSGSTSPDDQIPGVSASFDIGAFGTNVATFSLSNVTPATYSWGEVITADADTVESTSYQVNGVTVS